MDMTVAGSSLLLLAAVGAEIAWATRLQRLENLGWIVSLWRAGVALALMALTAAALAMLVRAFTVPAQTLGAQPQPGRVYSTIMASLATWTVFAALYWHLPGGLFN